MSGYRRLFTGNPGFLWLWMGQFLSQAGLRMYQIAIAWWLISPAQGGGGREIGLFMVVGALPAILLVKQIGRFIDRTPSKRILVIFDLLSFVVLSLIAILLGKEMLNFTGAVIAGFFLSLFQALLDPTLNKAVAEVVSPADIESGVAIQASTQSLANFGGAVLGAILIDHLGIPRVVILNAVAYLCAAFLNGIIGFPTPTAAEKGISGDGGISGWRILDSMPLLRNILIGFGLVNFFVTPILVVLPLYTSKILNGSASLLGYLEASLWIGLLIGSIFSKYFDFVKSTIKLGAFCMTAAGVCIFLPGFIIHRYLFLLMLFLVGGSIGVNNVKFVSLFQETVDPKMKGRFFALMQALISFTFPIAYFLFGFLSDVVGPANVCAIQGLGITSVALLFFSLVSREDELNQYKVPVREARPLV